MSFFLLRDEYSISVEKNYLWSDFGTGVTKQFEAKWTVLQLVIKQLNYLWTDRAYVVREWQAKWNVFFYVSRQIEYLYNISLDFGAKVKYHFKKTKSPTRFFRSGRNG